MRLTTDLINKSLSYINPLNERELDLRGHKISAIENLGAARDNDCIDFTDNDIAQLGNFPLIPRIVTLLLAQNRIHVLQPSLAASIPNIKTLVLTKNKLTELADLEPLSGFKRLAHLSLLENPVTQRENYREWVVWLCPKLRLLDFQRVKDKERKEAVNLFGTLEEPTELASEILGNKSRSFDTTSTSARPADGAPQGPAQTLTEEDKKIFERLIRNAKSLAEIQQLEKYMSEGRLPPGVDRAEGAEQPQAEQAPRAAETMDTS